MGCIVTFGKKKSRVGVTNTAPTPGMWRMFYLTSIRRRVAVKLPA
jgi:hypothetical protein